MKKLSFVVLALSMFSISAYATPSNNCNGNGSCATNSTTNVSNAPVATANGGIVNGGDVDVRNTNTNLNNNSLVTNQGQLQGQQQTTTNSNNASQQVNVEGSTTTFEQRRIPASTAVAYAPMPSATCRSGAAGGLQTGIFGLSLGGDRAVDTCEINEAARIATAMGNTLLATEIFCQNKWAKNSTTCKALASGDSPAVKVGDDLVVPPSSSAPKSDIDKVGSYYDVMRKVGPNADSSR